MNDETLTENILEAAGIFMSGTWHGRDRIANFANGPILYGNFVLLCKKFREASFLVSWNKFI